MPVLEGIDQLKDRAWNGKIRSAMQIDPRQQKASANRRRRTVNPFWWQNGSVRRGAVKSNRVIFRVGINEAEDAVAVGGVGADGNPIGSAETCSRLNQARLVRAAIASKLEAAAGQNTTNEDPTCCGGAYEGQCAWAGFPVETATIIRDYVEAVAARSEGSIGRNS